MHALSWHVSSERKRSRIVFLLAISFLTLIAPVAIAQPAALPPSAATASATTKPDKPPFAFTIVSIKRHGNAPDGGKEGCYVDGCHFVDRPLLAFIMTAYNLSQKPILGDPLPGDSDLFDLDAKIDPADLPATPLSSRQLADMLQPVLADRFHLRVHHEMRALHVYSIVLAKGGLKMKESAPPAPGSPASPAGCFHTSVGNGLRVMHGCTMGDIRNILEGPTGRYLIDKTGLTGRYDFDLHWTPDNTPVGSPLDGGPSIFTAVQEQLGFKLEPAMAPVDVLVVDSARSPTPN
jgi:uncharacterized protein (TIGR03435 family)